MKSNIELFSSYMNFYKEEIPDDDKEEFAMELMKYLVSLQQYQMALSLDNVTLYVSTHRI